MESGKKLKSLGTMRKSTVSESAFDLEYYQTYNHTAAKDAADMWRRGDYEAIVKKNMEGKKK